MHFPAGFRVVALPEAFTSIPAVKIEVPAINETVPEDVTTFYFEGTASIPGDDIERVEWRRNGGPWQIADGTTNWSFTETALESEVNLIEVRATAIEGARNATATRTIVRQPPDPDKRAIWTKMNDSTWVYEPLHFVDYNVPHPDNTPGARMGSVTWIDELGSLWLFGGLASYAPHSSSVFDDLWRYDPSTHQWTLERGTFGYQLLPVRGTKGEPHPDNTPGSRFGSATWTGADGQLWLFGGGGYQPAPPQVSEGAYFADLWRYNPDTKMWTWVKGPAEGDYPGSYGTQGVADPANNPRSRYAAATWVDKGGNLWLFGGRPENSASYFNDLWRYDPESNIWTWMKGTDSINSPDVHETEGEPHPDNTPRGRGFPASWTDNDGRLWLFGRRCRYLEFEENQWVDWDEINDLWMYDPDTDMWTLVSGADFENFMGVFGDMGVSHPENVPGIRGIPLAWADLDGDLWFFGGLARDREHGDLWRFSPKQKEWTWMHGPPSYNRLANYGDEGQPHPDNFPGTRSIAHSWRAPDGRAWVYGGWGFTAPWSLPDTPSNFGRGNLGDMWRLDVFPYHAPLPAISEPDAMQRVPYEVTAFDLAGTAFTEKSTVASVEWRRNGGAWQMASGTDDWTFTVAGLEVGGNFIEVRATNTEGEHGPHASRMIVREELPPAMGDSWFLY